MVRPTLSGARYLKVHQQYDDAENGYEQCAANKAPDILFVNSYNVRATNFNEPKFGNSKIICLNPITKVEHAEHLAAH